MKHCCLKVCVVVSLAKNTIFAANRHVRFFRLRQVLLLVSHSIKFPLRAFSLRPTISKQPRPMISLFVGQYPFLEYTIKLEFVPKMLRHSFLKLFRFVPLQHLIEFVYCGKVTIPGELLKHVCMASHALGVHGLVEFLPVSTLFFFPLGVEDSFGGF